MPFRRQFRWTWAWLLAPLAALPVSFTACADPAVREVEPATSRDGRAAVDPDLGKKWVRLFRDKQKQPVAMQTAVVRYVPASDFASGKRPDAYRRYVDLVGAVHIADRDYYRDLNRRFKQYDAVLYELVAPEGTVVPQGRGTSNSHPLGAMQNGMKQMLEVEHQLEQIDYTAANFVHADLSPDEFLESMEDREEGFVQMYFKVLGASLAHQSQQAAEGESPDVEIMSALFADDRARRLKIALAKQFEGMEQLLVGLSGPEGSTLITERNKRALDVLENQFDDGKERLAVFYGAGHLSDMHQQLQERFDMQPVSCQWLDAWDLRAE